GHTNTGIANSGNVGTGAFMSGNFSNGLLWRGDHEGLFSLFYSLDVPRITIVDAHLDGGFGPVVLPPIPVPAVNAHLTGNVAMGAFTIPQIDIPALTPNITGSAAFRIVVGSVRIPPVSVIVEQIINASVGAEMRIDPFEMWTQGTNGLGITFYSFGSADGSPYATGPLVFGAGTSDGSHLTISASSGAFTTPQLETGPITLGFQVPGSVNAITLFPGGLTFPATSLLNLDVTAGAGGVDIPAITWPEIAASADGSVYVLASSIPLINIPPTPGIGNSTITPSSGFFNAGAGGGSGFGNFGAGTSGWWNQAHTALAGAGSGFANVGTLHSGVLNLGSGVSGIYNTSTLGVGTPALVSGLGNVGHQLSGLLSGGSAVNPVTVLNIGLANVGSHNAGFGNVGEVNLGAANLGAHNLGFGNIGAGNLGFGNIGHGNVGVGNSGLTAGVPGLGNVGLGNAGGNNWGLANVGGGNIGLANTG
ncbi:pentapeptide repeat-containing protein, partial [Mycobacterium tuberculosis]|uniref:pentapeptide repeat-containing protein n=1 Tax=Mycobacterium tuberculosis TaxID=1773 RepID=UPI000B00C108